jgi:hypothetical protein
VYLEFFITLKIKVNAIIKPKIAGNKFHIDAEVFPILLSKKIVTA